MSDKLTEPTVRRFVKVPPTAAETFLWDSEVAGFGVKLTQTGRATYMLFYRTIEGRQRKYSLGLVTEWPSVAAARDHAAKLKRNVRDGADPVATKKQAKAALSVEDLCNDFERDHLPRLRPGSAAEYRKMLAQYVRPRLGKTKVAKVTFDDIDKMHRAVSEKGVKGNAAPGRANRLHQCVRKMFAYAVQRGLRADNPAKGVERNAETHGTRYLSGEEIARLTDAIAKHADTQAANIFRVLMLTGARRGEVQAMRWDQLNLEDGLWVKPASSTKQAREHRTPISAPTRQLLADLYKAAEAEAKKAKTKVSEWVFPSHGKSGHRVELKKNWAQLLKAAKITQHARIHDLRHSFASHLVSSGASLPLVGALLGHSGPNTTARYAHLLDSAQREATERVAAIYGQASTAEVIPMRGGQK